MQLHPNHLEFTNDNFETFSGFGVFESKQIGFLGNLTLESVRDTFWDNIMGNNTRLFIMNTSDERLSKFLLEKIDSKPKELQIIWFFFNQKTLRKTLRKITTFKTQFLALPKNWFCDEANLLERKFSRLGVADFLPKPEPTDELSDEFIDFLSIL